MKNLILLISFLMLTTTYAQKKPVDKMEETKTTKTTINKNGEKVSESTVKVTTKKEQEIKTVQRKGNTPDGDKVETPVKVTKTIQIDRDFDPFYDVNDKMIYYTYNDDKYTFASDSKGFLITSPENSTYGQARKSASNHFYLMTIKGHPGVGYFDRNGTFVIEYYDKEKDAMIMESYERNKF
ncbi:MAG TPA: hypothetical protein VKZ98_04065 [Aquaticitalea sp.]|nr:hypothetical protein [Aquaticitalea sp.]